MERKIKVEHENSHDDTRPVHNEESMEIDETMPLIQPSRFNSNGGQMSRNGTERINEISEEMDVDRERNGERIKVEPEDHPGRSMDEGVPESWNGLANVTLPIVPSEAVRQIKVDEDIDTTLPVRRGVIEVEGNNRSRRSSISTRRKEADSCLDGSSFPQPALEHSTSLITSVNNTLSEQQKGEKVLTPMQKNASPNIVVPTTSPPSSLLPSPLPNRRGKAKNTKVVMLPVSPPVASGSGGRPVTGAKGRQSKSKVEGWSPTRVVRADPEKLAYGPDHEKNKARFKAERVMDDLRPQMAPYWEAMKKYKEELKAYEEGNSEDGEAPIEPHVEGQLTAEQKEVLNTVLKDWTLLPRQAKEKTKGYALITKHNNQVRLAICKAFGEAKRATPVRNRMGMQVKGNPEKFARNEETVKAIQMGVIGNKLKALPKPKSPPRNTANSMYSSADYAGGAKARPKKITLSPKSPKTSPILRPHNYREVLSPIRCLSQGRDQTLCNELEMSCLGSAEPTCAFKAHVGPEPFADLISEYTVEDARGYFKDLNTAIVGETNSWKLLHTQLDDGTLEAVIPARQHQQMMAMEMVNNTFGIGKGNVCVFDQLVNSALEAHQRALIISTSPSEEMKEANAKPLFSGMEKPIVLENFMNWFMEPFMNKLTLDGLNLPPINNSRIIGKPPKVWEGIGKSPNIISTKDLPHRKTAVLIKFLGKPFDAAWRMSEDGTVITYADALSLLTGKDLTKTTLDIVLNKLLTESQKDGFAGIGIIKWSELESMMTCGLEDFLRNKAELVNAIKSRVEKMEWMAAPICCPGVQFGIAKIFRPTKSISLFMPHQTSGTLGKWAGSDWEKLKIMDVLVYLKKLVEFIFSGENWSEIERMDADQSDSFLGIWPMCDTFEHCSDLLQSHSKKWSAIYVAMWFDKKLPKQISAETDGEVDEKCALIDIKPTDIRIKFLELLEKM